MTGDTPGMEYGSLLYRKKKHGEELENILEINCIPYYVAFMLSRRVMVHETSAWRWLV